MRTFSQQRWGQTALLMILCIDANTPEMRGVIEGEGTFAPHRISNERGL